ncbi:thioredoxin family protein [Candidatus Uabimicrobium sp. HlEnr_7]|uniref:thioredoxin family protein n=1 Tax=Candidatus Uabimicrobium helgolandensis TaxID=3095367 RepID=UPI0035579C8D
MSKTVIFFLSLCVAVTCYANEVATKGAEVGKWTMDVDAAYKLAKQKQLPILMNFTGSDWCGWCKLMDKNVFAENSWQTYAQKNLVLVTIDFPSNPNIVPEEYKQRNKKLQEKYGVRGYPTYVLLNKSQEAIAQLGAGKEKTAESFRGEIDAAIHLSPAGIEATLKKLSGEQRKQYKALLKKNLEINDSLEKWISTRPERNEANLKKYNQFVAKITAIEKELKKYW